MTSSFSESIYKRLPLLPTAAYVSESISHHKYPYFISWNCSKGVLEGFVISSIHFEEIICFPLYIPLLRHNSPILAISCAITKGAVISFTRAMLLDYAEVSVRINTICPGIEVTRMTKKLLESMIFAKVLLLQFQ